MKPKKHNCCKDCKKGNRAKNEACKAQILVEKAREKALTDKTLSTKKYSNEN